MKSKTSFLNFPPPTPAPTPDALPGQAKLKSHELQAHAALDTTRVLYFSVVAEKGSLSHAAEALGVNVSTVSRKMDELEASLGVRLLDRDARNFRLTEAGETYLYFTLKVMGTLEAGRQTMERYSSNLKGLLRVLCPPAIGRRFVADLAVSFGKLHPRLQVSLKLDSKPFSLADAEFDVALCLGMPAEERAVVSKLGVLTRGYVATPGFLRAYGVPDTIHSLARLPMTEIAFGHNLHEQIVLTNAAGETAFSATKLLTNDSEVALCAVLSDGLVGRIMHFYCDTHLRDGRLVKVMPELDDTRTIYTVVSSRKGNPRKVQMFVDYLKAHLTHEFKSLNDQFAEADELHVIDE